MRRHMNLDTFLTTIIQNAVREAVREELETLKTEWMTVNKVKNTSFKDEREIPKKRIIRFRFPLSLWRYLKICEPSPEKLPLFSPLRGIDPRNHNR